MTTVVPRSRRRKSKRSAKAAPRPTRTSRPAITADLVDEPLPRLRAAIVLPDGTFRRFTDMPDPRAGFSQAFNGLEMHEVAFPWVPAAIVKVAPLADKALLAMMLAEVEEELTDLQTVAEQLRQRLTKSGDEADAAAAQSADDDHEPPPELFAVIERGTGRVVARGMSEAKAGGFASGWARSHGPVEIVVERVEWEPVLALLERGGRVVLDNAWKGGAL